MNRVVAVAHRDGEGFDLGAEVVQGLVADVEQPLETARSDAVDHGAADAARDDDVAASDLRAARGVDGEDRNRPEDRGAGHGRGGRVVELAELSFEQRLATRRENRDLAVLALEGRDVDVVGDHGHRAVALVLESGGIRAADARAGDRNVEIVDHPELGVDGVDRRLDLFVGFRSQRLDACREVADAARERDCRGHHLEPLRRVFGVDRESLERGSEVGEFGRDRGIARRGAEARLDLVEERLGGLGRAERRALDSDFADQEAVDESLDAGDLDAAALAGDDPPLQLNDLARVANGVGVGNVLRDGAERGLADGESA